MPQKPTIEEKGKGYLYLIDNEVDEYLRRITRACAKNIGGFPIIPVLPRREYQKKDHPQLEDSVLVEYLEELVEIALQEVVHFESIVTRFPSLFSFPDPCSVSTSYST